MKSLMPLIHHAQPDEYYFAEGCFITESWNAPTDEAVSVARARVAPEVTTRWHRLHGVTERYDRLWPARLSDRTLHGRQA